jgi:tRNA-specific 2-thiouridylase
VRERPAVSAGQGSAGFELLKGLDATKDQSYFLHRLAQAQLAKTLFPVGELAKTEVRRLAAEIGLPNAKKKDSTGICFIGERPFREFLSRYLANQPGPMLDERGREVGRHVGLSFYTLGQRQGLGIGGVREGGGTHAPWFVAAKDLARNALIVVQGHDHPWLQATALAATDCSWVAGVAPTPGRYGVKTRYRQADAPGELRGTPHGITVDFAPPHLQWAVTPGQSAVLYEGEICLGGGVIDHATVPALDAALRLRDKAAPTIAAAMAAPLAAPLATQASAPVAPSLPTSMPGTLAARNPS